jgi:hypothetical protein
MGTLILQGRRSGPRHRGFPACLVPARGACGLSQHFPDRPSGRCTTRGISPINSHRPRQRFGLLGLVEASLIFLAGSGLPSIDKR